MKFPGSMLDAVVDAEAEKLREIRRTLHAHPEPSREEYQTTLAIARWLAEAGIPYRLSPTGRGVIAGDELEEGRRLIAVRADIDGLRIQDAKQGVLYASTREGVMHACGHDAHTAMVLGASMALHRCREFLPAGVGWRAIFQPAEEMGDGAQEMIQVGAMEGVRAIVALHVDPERRVGAVGYRRGVFTACCRDFHVAVRGRGGHGARPYQCIDPIAAAVQYVGLVYQHVPRAVDARDPVVVTFGAIHGGESSNVIPDRVDLKGTVRTLSRVARERVDSAMRGLARAVAESTGAEIELTFLSGIESVINDRRVTEQMVEAALDVLGSEGVDEIPAPSLGGEDFAAYLSLARGAMIRLGVATELPWPPLHSPRFDIDERALGIGAKILARSVASLAEVEASDAVTAGVRAE